MVPCAGVGETRLGGCQYEIAKTSVRSQNLRFCDEAAEPWICALCCGLRRSDGGGVPCLRLET